MAGNDNRGFGSGLLLGMLLSGSGGSGNQKPSKPADPDDGVGSWIFLTCLGLFMFFQNFDFIVAVLSSIWLWGILAGLAVLCGCIRLYRSWCGMVAGRKAEVRRHLPWTPEQLAIRDAVWKKYRYPPNYTGPYAPPDHPVVPVPLRPR